MPTVVVTGGAGKLGRAVVEELANGWDVVVFDRARPPAGPRPGKSSDRPHRLRPGARRAVGGRGTLRRPDALVHLAAVPAPGIVPDLATFHNNMTAPGTWSARPAGRESPTSSGPPARPCSGCRSTPRRRTSRSTRSTPPRPESTYSLVKTLEEEMAAQLCRWDPELKMIGLRFSNVMEPADYAGIPRLRRRPAARKWNLWGYIDARDGAQAVRRRWSWTHRLPRCSSSPTPTP